MNVQRSAIVAIALIGLTGVGAPSAVPALADEIQTGTTELQAPPAAKPAEAKTHKRETRLAKAKPNAAEQYDAPLQLDFDPMKRVILRAEPAVPYQPQIASRLPPPTKTGDDAGQAHLAPLLRENSTPESFGDRGSFIDRHEFGIQLHDHF
jgi:hypothetical protein